MSEHLPRHVLEAWLADAAALPLATAHLAECERCSERVRVMEDARAAFLRAHSPHAFASKVLAARRPRLQPSWIWAAACAALALLAFTWVLRDPSEPEIRYRGTSVSLQAYVRGQAGVRALREGEVLSAGAQLAFVYTLSEPRHLLLFGIDDAGTITRYFPDGDIAQSDVLAAGAAQQLPVGIELDARRGRERLIALFSAKPLDQDSARATLATAWREASARGRGISEPLELTLPAQQISYWFDKP